MCTFCSEHFLPFPASYLLLEQWIRKVSDGTVDTFWRCMKVFYKRNPSESFVRSLSLIFSVAVFITVVSFHTLFRRQRSRSTG